MDAVSLSDGEKLILLMLCDAQEALKIKSDIDPQFVRKCLQTGNSWALAWQYPGIFGISDVSPETVREKIEILEMWTALERSQDSLADNPRDRLGRASALFAGFDGTARSAIFPPPGL